MVSFDSSGVGSGYGKLSFESPQLMVSFDSSGVGSGYGKLSFESPQLMVSVDSPGDGNGYPERLSLESSSLYHLAVQELEVMTTARLAY